MCTWKKKNCKCEELTSLGAQLGDTLNARPALAHERLSHMTMGRLYDSLLRYRVWLWNDLRVSSIPRSTTFFSLKQMAAQHTPRWHRTLGFLRWLLCGVLFFTIKLHQNNFALNRKKTLFLFWLILSHLVAKILFFYSFLLISCTVIMWNFYFKGKARTHLANWINYH